LEDRNLKSKLTHVPASQMFISLVNHVWNRDNDS